MRKEMPNERTLIQLCLGLLHPSYLVGMLIYRRFPIHNALPFVVLFLSLFFP